jgi:hypothetical protein
MHFHFEGVESEKLSGAVGPAHADQEEPVGGRPPGALHREGAGEGAVDQGKNRIQNALPQGSKEKEDGRREQGNAEENEQDAAEAPPPPLAVAGGHQ